MSKKQRKYAVGGERLTLAELSHRTGIARSTLRQRWQAGKREQALITPVDRREAGRIAARSKRPGPVPDLNPDPATSYEDIASEMGILPRSVYQIERIALAKIRRQLGLS